VGVLRDAKDMQPALLPQSNQLFVVIGRESAAARLTELAAWLALRGALFIIDGGNRSNPYPLARQLRRWSRDPVQALNNVQIARAFTCYQVIALLERAFSTSPNHQPAPMLIYDLLATFYDESVSFSESKHLFEHSLSLLRLIHQSVPVVVSARPPIADFPQRRCLLEQLCQAAHQVWEENSEGTQEAKQLPLFDPLIDLAPVPFQAKPRPKG